MLRDAVRSAVVWRTGALGDFVLTTPVLDAVRQRSEHLLVIAPRRYQDLWNRADRWLDSDGPEALGLYRGGALDAELGLAWTDVAADALEESGVDVVLRGRPMPLPSVHQVDSLWEPLLPWLGPRRQDPHLEPTLTIPNAPTVVIAPGSGGAAKRWPMKRWGRIAAALPDVCWAAGPLEADMSWPGKVCHPSLAELVALAGQTGVWLGPDSGPQHLAAAAGATVGVAFTDRTNPANWAPVGSRVFRPTDPDDVVIGWALKVLSS